MKIGRTMIYVTHDQTEALTFADRVVVMYDGKVVQVGTPVELFEHPAHTFVGHFIGSPGMNILPCEVADGASHFSGNRLQTACKNLPQNGSKEIEVGIRPEFVQFDDKGFPVEIVKVDDLGRHQIVVANHENNIIKIIVAEGEAIPSESPRISFSPEHTRLYQNSWVVD